MSEVRTKSEIREFLSDLHMLLKNHEFVIEGDVCILDKTTSTTLGYLSECYSSLDLVTEDGDVIVSFDK